MFLNYFYFHGYLQKCKQYYIFGVFFLSCLIVIQFHQSFSIINQKLDSFLLIKEINSPFNYEKRSKILDNTCNHSNTLSSDMKISGSMNLIRTYPWLHSAIFPVQSQSLMYCAIPKIASKTLVSLMIYVYIRDTIDNLTKNGTDLDRNRNQVEKLINIPKLIKELKKNGISIPDNGESIISLIETYLHLLRFESINDKSPSLFLNPWRFSLKDVFPNVHFTSLTNLSSVFSPEFTRALFVRHPFERLASAYKERIGTLAKDRIQAEPHYDNVRKMICRRYSRLNFIERNDPCTDYIPSFEHFVQYILTGTETTFGISRMDTHWQPFTVVCQVCKFQYNFIGKYETFNEDFDLLLKRVNVTDWKIEKRRGASGHKTKDYQQLYLSLPDDSICRLKRLYNDDFQLFNYRIEDYVNRTTLKC
ncbi:hypothetical protein I4U23_011518 [Adineta vaga]|nr:hypothetical protein I4U23_011518 [Adineta vaga]